eukprot:CAMPEP_0176100472 /NCGR_PEP_ID=MMETSP0120_2-20121206/50391_1 /TAXON_ID=160619 /ORGANISM="Kryptoperidinium foliaceum, Strain CCMP 1326" /LENGTH=62 /DNA_ID=CAMNT_0017434515 /DNA_START=12 /DNA_END=197 /DNA_ORIENTATION=+
MTATWRRNSAAADRIALQTTQSPTIATTRDPLARRVANRRVANRRCTGPKARSAHLPAISTA